MAGKVYRNETDPREIDESKGVVRPFEALLRDLEALKTDRTSTELVDETIYWLSQLRQHNEDLEKRLKADPAEHDLVLCQSEDGIKLFLDGTEVSGYIQSVNLAVHVNPELGTYISFKK